MPINSKCVLAGFCLIVFCLILPHYSFPSPKSESKVHFKKGIKLYKRGRIEDALVEFHKAYVIYPHWKIRKNIGLCYMKLGDYVLAMQELNAYLEEGRSQLSQKEEDAVMNVIFSILENVGIIRFTTIPPGATVIVDGERHNDITVGEDIYVEPGLHVISVLMREGNLSYREETYIAAGEIKEITPTIQKTVSMASGQKSEIPQWKEIKPGGKKRRRLKPGYFWSSVGATLATAAVATAVGVGTYTVNKKFHSEDDEEKRNRLKEKGKKLQLTTNIFIGISTAVAVTSAVLFFFTKFEKEEKTETVYPSVSISPTPGSVTTTLKIQF